MAREDLYVAMSRGRALNHTYIALEQPDPDCLPDQARPPLTAREVLDRILTTTHAQLTATETWAAFHPQTPDASRRRFPVANTPPLLGYSHPARGYAGPDPADNAPAIGR